MSTILALTLAVLLTPLSALAQDVGGSVASPAAPAARGVGAAKPAAAPVKPKQKPLRKKAAGKGAPAKIKGGKPEALPDRSKKRGARLREKGEALGGDSGERLEAAAEKKEAQAYKRKKDVEAANSRESQRRPLADGK